EDSNADNWNVDGLEVFYVGREFRSARLSSIYGNNGAYLHRFTKNYADDMHSPTWQVPLEADMTRAVVQVDVWTGGDDLRCCSAGSLDILFQDGTTWSDGLDQRLASYSGLVEGERFERPVALPPGHDEEAIDQVGLRLLSGPGCGEPSADQDNWNVDRLLVS